MTKARLTKVNKVLSQRQPDLTVIMEGVHKPHNVAAIVRSCEAVGVMEVHMVKPGAGPGARHASISESTAAGSQNWVRSYRYEEVTQPLANLRQRGFQVLAANSSSRAINYRQADFCRPTAILLGTELHGVSEQAKAAVDGEIFIPMMGMVESFNVSVACAIILAEAQRQKMAAGHYEFCKLEPDQLKKLQFEWLHPDVAAHYRKQAKPYPAIDEEGDVIFSN